MSTRDSRRLAAVVMALGGALTIAACGSSAGPDGSFTVVAPTSVPAGTTTTFPAPPTVPTSTEPVKIVDDVEPTAPTRDDATVDARDYELVEEHPLTTARTFSWRSPTGKTTCAVYLSDAHVRTGCQTKGDPPMPEAPCPAQTSSAVQITSEDGVEQFCVSQSLFDSGNYARELAYDNTIVIQNVSCTSAENGMTCFADGHSFRLSADESIVYS